MCWLDLIFYEPYGLREHYSEVVMTGILSLLGFRIVWSAGDLFVAYIGVIATTVAFYFSLSLEQGFHCSKTQGARVLLWHGAVLILYTIGAMLLFGCFSSIQFQIFNDYTSFVASIPRGDPDVHGLLKLPGSHVDTDFWAHNVQESSIYPMFHSSVDLERQVTECLRQSNAFKPPHHENNDTFHLDRCILRYGVENVSRSGNYTPWLLWVFASDHLIDLGAHNALLTIDTVVVATNILGGCLP